MTIVFSDTGCDISKEMAEKYDIKLIFMPFSLDDKEYTKDGEISSLSNTENKNQLN